MSTITDPSPRGTAVLAGCGRLGTDIGLRLASQGHHVLGLRRRPERLPHAIAGQRVDLGRQPPRLPADTALVIGALTADQRTEEGYQRTYLTGLRHLLDAIEQLSQPPRILWVSSTAVYGVNDGSWVDEATPADPTTATGTVLRETEALLHDRHREAVVVRLAGLYDGFRSRLVQQVRDGTVAAPRALHYTNRIHRQDAARALTHLATGPRPAHRLYLGVDSEPVARGELLHHLAAQLGVPAPPPPGEPLPRPTGKRCCNRRLTSTGFTFTYPTFREGYQPD